jgi:hypothetical protein
MSAVTLCRLDHGVLIATDRGTPRDLATLVFAEWRCAALPVDADIAPRYGRLLADIRRYSAFVCLVMTEGWPGRRLFLVDQLRPWHVNLGSGQIKSPKLHIVDSGLLTYLIGANERRTTDDGGVAGTLLESFIATELLRQADWAQEPVRLFHYRDKQQREVDVILERDDGEIVGVEVKSGATPASGDFGGLPYLRDKLGARFKAGVVLHTGADTLPFGDHLAAVPVSAIWS